MATIEGKRWQITDESGATPINLFPYTVSEAVYGLNNSISNAISSALSAISLSTYAGTSAIGSSVQPVYYNGTALVATDLSATYAPYNSAGYLPLTGGTLTGSGGNDVLIQLSTESVTSWMGFRPSDGTFRYIGINNSNELLFQYASRSYTVWHSGNDGAGSGLDADLLHGFRFITTESIDYNNITWNTILFSATNNVTNRPLDDHTYGIRLKQEGELNVYFTDLATGLSTDALYYRRHDYINGYNNWHQIAFTDSNVASATKLQTPRLIWGQSFDGTANVTGSLTNVPAVFFGDNMAGIYIHDHGISWHNSSNLWTAEVVTIDSSYNVGIGTPHPSQKLHVDGNILSTGDQIINSDLTMKTNLQDVTYSVSDIAKCRAVTFDWKDGHGHSAGSIAQDWKPLIPELVHGEEGGMTLAYGQIALVNSILEAREIERLKERVAELENQLKMRS